MPAYLIADITITDAAAYSEYVKQAPACVAAFGGRYLVRGGAAENLEGDWQPNRIVVLEFPDMDRLRAFYGSDLYAGPLALRLGASISRSICVEGASPLA